MKKISIIVCISIGICLSGCASKKTVVCVTPTGMFEPQTGQELFEEINNQFPFTVKPDEFICKIKYDRLIGWAIIPDKQASTLKDQLKQSETLNLLQVQALNEKLKTVIKNKWKTAQAVSLDK